MRTRAGEFRHGTAIPTFLATPVRRRVVTAKLAAHLTLGLLVTLVAIALQLAIALPWLAADGHGIAPWSADVTSPSSPPRRGRLLQGVGIGLLVRNQLVALIVAIGWFTIAESTLAILALGIARFLPGGLSGVEHRRPRAPSPAPAGASPRLAARRGAGSSWPERRARPPAPARPRAARCGDHRSCAAPRATRRRAPRRTVRPRRRRCAPPPRESRARSAHSCASRDAPPPPPTFVPSTRPDPDRAAARTQREHLAEQLGDRRLMADAEPRDRRVIRRPVGGDHPERQVIQTTPLDRARRAHPDRVGVDEQRDNRRRVVRGATPPVVAIAGSLFSLLVRRGRSPHTVKVSLPTDRCYGREGARHHRGGRVSLSASSQGRQQA